MTRTFLPTITGIVLMVPEAATIVPSAHISLLAPFGDDQRPTPAELADVAKFFAEQAPFSYRLTEVRAFPDGPPHLAPEPVSAFSQLTESLQELFPQYPPYGGQFDDVVPHLTLDDDSVVPTLPIQAHARDATVLHFEDGVFSEIARFPLGTSGA